MMEAERTTAEPLVARVRATNELADDQWQP